MSAFSGSRALLAESSLGGAGESQAGLPRDVRLVPTNTRRDRDCPRPPLALARRRQLCRDGPRSWRRSSAIRLPQPRRCRPLRRRYETHKSRSGGGSAGTPPSDTPARSPPWTLVCACDESVKLDDVLRLLDGARAAAKIIVFDACRSELQLPTKDTTKGLVPVAEQQGMFIANARRTPQPTPFGRLSPALAR